MNTNIEIYRLTLESDENLFRNIAQIHLNEISEGFLSTLGIDFLERLYKFIALSRHGFIFIATIKGQAIGFISGSTNTSRLYREFILNYGWKMLPVMLPKMFSLSLILKLKETLCYPQKKECRELPQSEILNFCVDRNFQRKGIARLLFGHLVKEFNQRKVNNFKIVTGSQQISAQRFYKAMKATHISDIIIHNGIISHVYIYNIVPTDF
jgi:ribosomal protein S18 acetylase RimI-like enzyme